MNRPSPLVLIILLLAAAAYLVDRPFIKALILCAVVALGCIALGRFAARRAIAARGALPPRVRLTLLLIAAVVACATFVGLLLTQPRLRSTCAPDHLNDVAHTTSDEGLHAVQVDAAGNRYVWTQQQATLTFDFLTHRPVTVTFMARSAAIAGGPDAPVRVVANGVEIGQLRPNPTNGNFQPLAIRFVPRDWGGQQTEITLVTTPYTPGKGDRRTLGTMIQSVSVDTSEAWSPIAHRIWLLWMLPALALAAFLLAALGHRRQAAWANYGAIVACAAGAVCALALIALIVRIGFIARSTYFAWLLGNVYIGACFALAALALPFGRAGEPGLARYARRFVRSFQSPIAADRVRALGRGRLLAAGDNLLGPATRKRIAGDLLLVFAIALGIRLVWAVLIPPWLAPDELDHYTYVSHIAEQGQIPHLPYPDYPVYPPEYETSWLLTRSADIRATDRESREQLVPHFPVTYDYGPAKSFTAPIADRLTQGGARAANYPPLYYLSAALPYRLLREAPILTRLLAARSTTALFGALSCVFGYLFAYEIRRCRLWGWGLALCLALLPMYVFDSAIVNNDAAMDLFAAAVVWLSARALLRPVLSPALALCIGIASGLTLLSKPTAFPVVAVAGAVIVIKAAPQLPRSFGQPRRVLGAIGAYAIAIAALYGPWLIFSARNLGGFVVLAVPIRRAIRLLTGVSPVAAMPLPSSGDPAPSPSLLSGAYSFPSYVRYEVGHGWSYFHQIFIETFWGTFGWLDVPLAAWVYVPITVFCIVGLVGAAIQLALQPERRPALLLAWGFVLAHVIFLFGAVNFYIYRTTGKDLGLSGRYFFPMLVPFLYLLLSGWTHLCREHPMVLRLAPALMLGLQLFSLATIVSHYYGVTIG